MVWTCDGEVTARGRAHSRQSRTMWSIDPEATVRPSGENATLRTGPMCACRVRIALARLDSSAPHFLTGDSRGPPCSRSSPQRALRPSD